MSLAAVNSIYVFHEVMNCYQHLKSLCICKYMNMDRFTNITLIDIDNCTDKEQKPQSTVFDQDLK